MRLDGKTVLRHIDPVAYERLTMPQSTSKYDSFFEFLKNELPIGRNATADTQESGVGDVIVPDPLARALAHILVEKKIATPDEIQRLADKFADEY